MSIKLTFTYRKYFLEDLLYAEEVLLKFDQNFVVNDLISNQYYIGEQLGNTMTPHFKNIGLRFIVKNVHVNIVIII